MKMTEGTKITQLTHGVSIAWITYEGEIAGGAITHPKPDAPNLDGLCTGAFWLRGNGYCKKYSKRTDEWDFSGTYDKPTLSPSFLCHCGFHGYVTDGEWVPA